MKKFHLIITVVAFLLNDILGNFLVEKGNIFELLESLGISIAWFRFFLVLVNFVIGAIYLKKYAPILVQAIWLALYLFIVSYFLIRWILNVLELLPDSFSKNSHLSLGLSVFTFIAFYLINLQFFEKRRKNTMSSD